MLQKEGLFVDVALATSFVKHDLQMDRKQTEAAWAGRMEAAVERPTAKQPPVAELLSSHGQFQHQGK